MKRNLTFFAALFIMIFSPVLISAQDEDSDKWGANPDNCKINLSLYVEFYRQKNFDDAYAPWSAVFRECPKASKNTYIHGIAIVTNKIANEKDPKVQKAYIDTLLKVYDQRIQYFGEEGKVLGLKAVQYNKLYPKDFENAYKIAKKSVELEGDASDLAVMNLYMQVAVEMHKAKKINDDELFNIYNTCSDVASALVKANPEDEKFRTVQNNLDALLVMSGIATCDKIIEIFTPKFENNKNDVGLVRATVKILDRQGCNDNKLFAASSEKLFELEPSALSAYSLARYFYKSNQFSKATEYYKKAIDMQDDNYEKARYYYELAVVTGTKMNQYSAGRTYAQKAIELRKNWGDPYILIGLIYAISAKDCGETFDQTTVYWAAVDKFITAKSVDPACADEANKQINSYSQYFPAKEEVFFHNLQDGQSYTVGCWINETTKVRAK